MFWFAYIIEIYKWVWNESIEEIASNSGAVTSHHVLEKWTSCWGWITELHRGCEMLCRMCEWWVFLDMWPDIGRITPWVWTFGPVHECGSEQLVATHKRRAWPSPWWLQWGVPLVAEFAFHGFPTFFEVEEGKLRSFNRCQWCDGHQQQWPWRQWWCQVPNHQQQRVTRPFLKGWESFFGFQLDFPGMHFFGLHDIMKWGVYEPSRLQMLMYRTLLEHLLVVALPLGGPMLSCSVVHFWLLEGLYSRLLFEPLSFSFFQTWNQVENLGRLWRLKLMSE